MDKPLQSFDPYSRLRNVHELDLRGPSYIKPVFVTLHLFYLPNVEGGNLSVRVSTVSVTVSVVVVSSSDWEDGRGLKDRCIQSVIFLFFVRFLDIKKNLLY